MSMSMMHGVAGQLYEFGGGGTTGRGGAVQGSPQGSGQIFTAFAVADFHDWWRNGKGSQNHHRSLQDEQIDHFREFVPGLGKSAKYRDRRFAAHDHRARSPVR